MLNGNKVFIIKKEPKLKSAYNIAFTNDNFRDLNPSAEKVILDKNYTIPTDEWMDNNFPIKFQEIKERKVCYMLSHLPEEINITDKEKVAYSNKIWNAKDNNIYSEQSKMI